MAPSRAVRLSPLFVGWAPSRRLNRCSGGSWNRIEAACKKSVSGPEVRSQTDWLQSPASDAGKSPVFRHNFYLKVVSKHRWGKGCFGAPLIVADQAIAGARTDGFRLTRFLIRSVSRSVALFLVSSHVATAQSYPEFWHAPIAPLTFNYYMQLKVDSVHKFGGPDAPRRIRNYLRCGFGLR